MNAAILKKYINQTINIAITTCIITIILLTIFEFT